MEIKEVISKIDTDRFGFKVAKINSFKNDIATDLNELKKLGVKLIISRVNSNNITLVNNLEELNFRIKDTQLTFTHDLKNIETYKSQINNLNEVKIEEAEFNDSKFVGDLAFEAFKGYGHYAANKELDSNKSNEIYRDWAQKSCVDKKVADYMFLAKINENVGGFLSLKVENKNGEKFGTQHLGAVDKKYRNLDIFRQLIIKCLNTGKEKKHSWQQTYLLTTNIPVMRSYLKLGFKISESHHTMHCWL